MQDFSCQRSVIFIIIMELAVVKDIINIRRRKVSIFQKGGVSFPKPENCTIMQGSFSQSCYNNF